MTDTTTKKPIRVRNGGIAGPYLKVPFTQIDDIRRLLDEHRIRYEVSENVISFNGAPEVAWVKFGRDGDTTVIQKIFDSAE